MNALPAPRHQRIRTPLGFSIAALLFYIVDGTLVRSALFTTNPDFLAAAISVDLTLGLTFVYWMFVVRPGHARLRSALPVFVLSVAAAALTLPAGHRDLVHYIRYLGIPFEFAAVVAIILGVRRAHRSHSAGVALDIPERIRASLTGTALDPRLASLVTAEISILFYALWSWRRKRFVPPGTRAFSYQKRNSLIAILYTFFLASVVEAAALHFLIRAFVPRVALVLLAISGFGALWILGFARAVQLRPILVSEDTIFVRTGIHLSVDIARSTIERVEYGRVKTPVKGTPGFLRATLGAPNVVLHLRTAATVHRAYGGQAEVSTIALVIDDVADFQRALA